MSKPSVFKLYLNAKSFLEYLKLILHEDRTGVTQYQCGAARFRICTRYGRQSRLPAPRLANATKKRLGVRFAYNQVSHFRLLNRLLSLSSAWVPTCAGRADNNSRRRFYRIRFALPGQPLNRCTAAAELFLQPLEPAVEVIDAIDDGLAFGR